MPNALACHKPNDRMAFLRAAYVFAKRMQQTGATSVAFRLPNEIPLMPENGKYELDELAAWLHADVADLSARYDARNGNDWYARRLARCDADVLAAQG